jgi:trigger factor
MVPAAHVGPFSPARSREFMLVTVEDQGKLRRKLSVEVPLTDVQHTYDTVFNEIRTQVRVPGFRPGKFPRALAEKRFRSLMAQEAVQNLVPKYFDQALKEKELRPATEPKFQNLKIGQKQPLTFDVEFEIVPAFELLPASAFKLEDKPIEVTPEQVETRVLELRKARSTEQDKGAEAAEAGDIVTFDFEGKRDGEVFPGGSGKGQRIEVGAGQFLVDFDAQFPGIKAGESKTFDLTFPADYGETTLAGKVAQFTITANKVERKVPAEMNADFFKQFGKWETEVEFRENLKGQLTREAERTQLSAQQQSLAEQVRAQYAFDVPETSVEALLKQYEHELSAHNEGAAPEADKIPGLLEERRTAILGDLRLDFVVDAYARKNDIQVGQKLLRERFMMQAYMMQQNPSELLKTEYGERMLSQLRTQMAIAKSLGHLVYVVLNKPVPPDFAPGADADEDAEAAALDHSGHDHSGHDHAGHDHSAHDHSGHDHEGHDHAH